MPDIDIDVHSSSLGNQIFLKLKDEILNGEIMAGSNLVETKISKKYDVSRTPVREAIIQLEREGLVNIKPRKGACVIGISKKDIDDIYSIRLHIEGLAVRWSTENITFKELEDLSETLDLQEFYTQKKNNKNITKIDSRFHQIIYASTKSKTLNYILNMLHLFAKNARETSFIDPARAFQTLEEHKQIYTAILNKDADSAEECMRNHVKNAWKSLNKR